MGEVFLWALPFLEKHKEGSSRAMDFNRVRLPYITLPHDFGSSNSLAI